MKTIPVSVLITGLLLPSVCLAQSGERPAGPPRGERGEMTERRGQGGGFMAAWRMADRDGDGTISQEEFEAMPRVRNLPEDKRAQLFKRLDKSGDGKLSREELGRFGKPPDGQDPPMKRLWELDADQSGGVSYEEFKAGGFFKKLPPEKQEMVFKRLDTDGDGVISPKDRPETPFKRADGKRGPKSERSMDDDNGPSEKPGQINKKLDLDGDGSVSFEEFRLGPAMKGLSEDQQEDRFELLDRNGDQKISPEDSPPAGK
jgi:Ca2+-binding EF-hand superfamily protein